MTESLRAFLTRERTINKVYTKQTVSLDVLQALVAELRKKRIANIVLFACQLYYPYGLNASRAAMESSKCPRCLLLVLRYDVTD